MFEVRHPRTGKVYTYGPARYADAVRLAQKLDAEPPTRVERFPSRSCPHGDNPNLCDRGACDEGWGY